MFVKPSIWRHYSLPFISKPSHKGPVFHLDKIQIFGNLLWFADIFRQKKLLIESRWTKPSASLSKCKESCWNIEVNRLWSCEADWFKLVCLIQTRTMQLAFCQLRWMLLPAVAVLMTVIWAVLWDFRDSKDATHLNIFISPAVKFCFLLGLCCCCTVIRIHLLLLRYLLKILFSTLNYSCAHKRAEGDYCL